MKFFIVFLSFILQLTTALLFRPASLASFDVTTTSISVSWRSVNQDVFIYFVTISPLDDNEDATGRQYTNQTYVSWGNLLPGKNYSITVTAQSRNGQVSSPSNIVVTTIPMSPIRTRISKFVNPVLTEYTVGQNQTMMFPVYGAVIMWGGPVAGHFDGFSVQISPPDGIVRLPITIQDGESIAQETKKQRIIWDLTPGVYYNFTVRTKSHGRMSTAASLGSRIPPEIPGAIKVISISPTSATLSWDNPHRGTLDGFVVEINPPEGRVVENESPETKWRLIENLTPGMIYQVDVYSISSGILSFQSRSTNITTPPNPPERPIVSTNITSTSITMRWETPTGKLDYFEIIYFPTSRDIGRLRHRIQDPYVRLSFLDPGTEYSIIIYSVSNKLYSKPLFTSISTDSLPVERMDEVTEILPEITRITEINPGVEARLSSVQMVTTENATSLPTLSTSDPFLLGSNLRTESTKQNLTSDSSLNVTLTNSGNEFSTNFDPESESTFMYSNYFTTKISQLFSTVSTTVGDFQSSLVFTSTPVTPTLPLLSNSQNLTVAANLIEPSTITSTDKLTNKVSNSTYSEANEDPSQQSLTSTSNIFEKLLQTSSFNQTLSSTTITPTSTSNASEFFSGDLPNDQHQNSTLNKVTTSVLITVAPSSQSSTDVRFQAVEKINTTTAYENILENSTLELQNYQTTLKNVKNLTALTTTVNPTQNMFKLSQRASTTESTQIVTNDTIVNGEETSKPFTSRPTTSQPVFFSNNTEVVFTTTNVDSTDNNQFLAPRTITNTTYPEGDEDNNFVSSPSTQFNNINTSMPSTAEKNFTKALEPFATSESPSGASTENYEENSGEEETTHTSGGVILQPNGNNIQIKNGFSTLCLPDNITILVDKGVIAEYERDYGPLHFNDVDDQECRGVEHDSYYRYSISPNILDCGTTIELNETHVNFTNSISNSAYRSQWLNSMTDNSGRVILGHRYSPPTFQFVHLRIWCTFPLDVNVTSAYPFLPQLTIQVINFNISGVGEFSAVMRIYKNASFDHPYLFPPTIKAIDRLYVGISLLDSVHDSTKMIVKRCWGTPERSPNHKHSYPIISESCAIETSLEGSVQIFGNGERSRVRWEGNVFKFVSYSEVWLHCEIEICFGEDCTPNCDGSRKKRSAGKEFEKGFGHVLSAGPIAIKSGKNVKNTPSVPSDPVSPTNPGLPFIPDIAIVVLIAVLSGVILISCFVIICFFRRLHRKRHQKHKSTPSLSPVIPMEAQTHDNFVSLDDEERSGTGERETTNQTIGNESENSTAHSFSLQTELKRQTDGRLNISYVECEQFSEDEYEASSKLSSSLSSVQDLSNANDLNRSPPDTL